MDAALMDAVLLTSKHKRTLKRNDRFNHVTESLQSRHPMKQLI